MMKNKILVILSIGLLLISISVFILFTINNASTADVSKDSNNTTKSNVNKTYTNDDFYAVIQTGIPKVGDKQAQTFGINSVDNPQDNWYVVTCTLDDAQDGQMKFVVSATGDEGALEVAFNPLRSSPTRISLLPEKVQKAMEDNK